MIATNIKGKRFAFNPNLLIGIYPFKDAYEIRLIFGFTEQISVEEFERIAPLLDMYEAKQNTSYLVINE